LALVPDPCYPVYRSASLLAGLEVRDLPLTAANRYLPELERLPKEVGYRAKLLFLNYPNNPTGATADAVFFAQAADWAVRRQVWVAHDAAHCELAFDEPHPSFLQAKGARTVGVEIGSLSKSFNMTGWRVGFAAGSAQAIQALVRVTERFGSGVFGAVQEAAAWALDHGDELVEAQRRAYAARRREFVRGLTEAGWHAAETSATYYVWARPPAKLPSKACAERLLDEAAVHALPGAGFGPSGEGWLRFSMTAPETRLEQALRRIARLDWNRQAVSSSAS
jgi:LL-diaminopimelate aminotransferase